MLLAIEKPRPDIEHMMSSYGDSLLRLCFMYLKDYQMAEDAVQETFIRAYTKYDSFRGDSLEKTWLTRIAINICKDTMRRKSFGEKPPDEDLPERPDLSASPEQQALENEQNARLMLEVYRLEPIYREVILLFYYSGLKVSEIASILKTREGTVKTRLMRARMRLGESLKEDYKEDYYEQVGQL